MTESINGNVIRLNFNADETTGSVNYTLPDGYSYKKILLLVTTNIALIHTNFSALEKLEFEFPVVNGMSPCTFKIFIADKTKTATLIILITKFGQKPDIHYFDKAFEPILVTGKDGEEYHMIPSDQFK